MSRAVLLKSLNNLKTMLDEEDGKLDQRGGGGGGVNIPYGPIYGSGLVAKPASFGAAKSKKAKKAKKAKKPKKEKKEKDDAKEKKRKTSPWVSYLKWQVKKSGMAYGDIMLNDNARQYYADWKAMGFPDDYFPGLKLTKAQKDHLSKKAAKGGYIMG